MPSRSIRWPPVILISGTSWRVGDVGDPAQLVGGRDAAADARDDGERAVVLDVRVDAVVDEARVALLAVAVAADLAHQVGEAGLAGAAVAAGAARGAQLADGLEAALADHRGQLLARLAPARAEVGRLLGRAAALDRSSSPTSGLHEPQPAPARVTLTTSSVEPRPRVRMASTISPLQTPWQLHTRALSGRSAAVAWLTPRRAARAGRSASRPVRTASSQQLGAAGVAEQDRADGAALGVDDQLAVAACRRRRTTARGAVGRAGAHEVDAHHLELRRGDRALVGGARPADRVRGDLRLLVDRRDDAVDDAAVLRALADREHASGARSPARRRRRSRARRRRPDGARERRSAGGCRPR